MRDFLYRQLVSCDIETTQYKLDAKVSDVLGEDWKLHFSKIDDTSAEKALKYVQNALHLYKEKNYIGRF